MSGLLEAFRTAYLANNEAFNRHDFETAFASLPDDVVWETLPELVDREPIEGKAGVIAAFHELLEQWPDWHLDVQDISEPSPRLIQVRFHATGTGAASGARTALDVLQEWDFRGPSLRIREYLA